jgi:hypothetical protein
MTYSATVQPGRQDISTRGQDVNESTVIGEGSQAIRAIGCPNSEHSRLRGRRRVASIVGLVTGSGRHKDTGRNGIGGGGVYSGGACATQRHVGDSAAGAAARLCIVGNVVDAGNDTGVGTLHLVSRCFREWP